jgi:UPF0271 protein
MKLINVDLGECLEPNPDSRVMPLLDMANIACGGHAGDEESILATLSLAKQYQKTIGAHPSYEDKAGFGRKSQSLTSEELSRVLLQQIQLFQSCCEQLGLTMSYIKPHGALYHDMMQNRQVLADICQFIADFDAKLSLVVQAGINTAEMEAVSNKTGIRFIYEAFADRAYQANQLVSRSEPNAILSQPEQIAAQYHSFSDWVSFQVDTVCFHSDHSASIEALKLIRQQ